MGDKSVYKKYVKSLGQHWPIGPRPHDFRPIEGVSGEMTALLRNGRNIQHILFDCKYNNPLHVIICGSLMVCGVIIILCQHTSLLCDIFL